MMVGLRYSLAVGIALAVIVLATAPADAAKKSPCKQRMNAGPCEAAMRRFYFNGKTGECEQFSYGGCKGNKNRFKSKAKCEKRCKKGAAKEDPKPMPEVCGLEKVVGRCRAAHRRFYYNKTEKKCTNFIYGGCGANGNNFKTLKECKNTCE